jgi:NADPH:quinone reductase-like Zn-dependent oxidoreductase
MHAWRRSAEGELVLGEVATPLPQLGEVLIKISAAGINPVDFKASKRGVKISTGVDGAGQIVAIGQDTECRYSIGDRVMFHASLHSMRNGDPNKGSFAHYCTVRAEALVPVPDSLSDADAAALPCPAGTAQQIVDSLHEVIRQSQVEKPAIFVQGASGAVARFVVQLLVKDYPNLRVIGSSSPSSQGDLSRLGVLPVSYKDEQGNTSPELELSNVMSAANQNGLRLIGIVNFQGGASVDLHFSSLNEAGKLVCVLNGPTIKTGVQSQSPAVGMIALGQAYDVAAAVIEPKVAVEAYQSVGADSAINAMAQSYQRVVSRINSSEGDAIELPPNIRQIGFRDIAATLQSTTKTVALIED